MNVIAKKVGFTFGAIWVFAPLVAFAAGNGNVTDINTLVGKITDIINLVIPLLIAIAVVWFIFNVVKYVLAADNEEKRGKAKDGIVHGLIGLFVIVAFWGLVNIVVNTLNLDNRTPDINVPGLLPRGL